MYLAAHLNRYGMGGPTAGSPTPSAAASTRVATTEPPVIGKRELLQWLNDVLGDIGEDVDFSTLRFGHVFLRLFEIIWPDVMKTLPHCGNLHPETPADVAANWDVIEGALESLEVPLSFVNQSLIRIGNFGACYQSLVFLFFLYCLARDHECEFVLAHSVEPALTEFMSSGAPLACLISGGAVSVPHPLKERILTPRPSARHMTGNEGTPEERGLASGRGDTAAQPNYREGNFASNGRKVGVLDENEQQYQLQHANTQQQSDTSSFSKMAPGSPSFPTVPFGENERRFSVLTTQETSASTPSPRVVGGAFTSDGSFCSGKVRDPASQNSLGTQHGGSRRDAHVQTQIAPYSELQEWQLPPPDVSLEWCGEGQKLKGEQLIGMLRYQNDLLKQQLGRAADEAAVVRRHHAQQIRDMKEATAVELQRVKEKCNADLLDQQAKHSSAIQTMRHQLDMRIRQIEDDVTIDIEVLSSSSTVGGLAQISAQEEPDVSAEKTVSKQEGPGGCAALAKVKKLQELMEERLRAREAAANEIKQLLQDTLEQCAAYRRDSDSRWSQWKRCEDLKESLMQLVSPSGQSTTQHGEGRDVLATARQGLNDEVQKLLEQSGFPIPQISALEQKLLAALVESLCLQHAQQARHRQEELELTRLLHQAQKSDKGVGATNGGIATIQNELMLEEQVRRLEAQNQRLLRTSEYLRLKVEHLSKWKAEDGSFIQQCQEHRPRAAAPTETCSRAPATKTKSTVDVEDVDGEGGEFSVPSVLLQQSTEAIDRDSELLNVLKNLGRRCTRTFSNINEQGKCTFLSESDSERARSTAVGVDEITITAATKKRLLQLFWHLLGDFYKFKSRLEEGHHQLRRMQQLVRTTMKEKLSVERAAEKERTKLVCSFEEKIQRERSAFQKTIGRNLVKLLAAQEQVEILQKAKNKQEDEHEALLQVLHQADNKRFTTILAKLHSVEMTNRLMQKREHFWNELAKALSSQLSNPSEKTQRAIQDLWAQLMGSKALIASDIMDLTSDHVSLQLNQVEKTAKKEESTPRSARLRSARSPINTTATKQNVRTGTGLNVSSSGTPTPKAAGKPRGSRASLAGSAGSPAGSSALSSAQPSASTVDPWSPADSFAKCLREICCHTAAGGSQNDISSVDIPSLMMQANSDSEDDSNVTDTALSQQLLSLENKLTTENCTNEMPKDWVNLLKLMAQEATALFRKHKTILDNEVEELKRERAAHLEKYKKLMLQLSDQQMLCSSIREQHDFFRQQHELALESLERAHDERASMEEAQKEVENELRRESAELRIRQAELQKTLQAVASHFDDIPFIVTLCAPHIGTSAASQSKPDTQLGPTIKESFQPCEANNADAGNSADRHLQNTSVEENTLEDQVVHSIPVCRQASVSGFASACGPSYQRANCAPPVQEPSDNISSQQTLAYQRRESLKCTSSVQARGIADAAECKAEQGALSPRSMPFRQSSKSKDPSAGDREGKSIPSSPTSCGFAGKPSASPSAKGNRSEAQLLEEEEDNFPWEEEMNCVPSTTLPTPRSPPKAALAPLVSPSRLVQALHLQIRTPKEDRRDSRQACFNRDTKDASVENKPADTEHSCRDQTEPSGTSNRKTYPRSGALLNRWPSSLDRNVAHQSTVRHDAPEYGLLRRISSGNVRRLAGRPSELQAPMAADLRLGTDGGPQINRNRAAAEQAWEDFVGAYGHSSRKQYAFKSTHRRADSWNSVIVPSNPSRSSSQDSVSETEFGPELLARKSVIGDPTSRARHRAEEGTASLTRETTDSALQNVLNIEQGLRDDLGNIRTIVGDKPDLSKEETDDIFVSDDTNQLGISASTFLRRLGTQLETRMRASPIREPRLN